MSNRNTKDIARLNDTFRKTFALNASMTRHPLGVHRMSNGFSSLSPSQKIEAAMKIRNFKHFNLMNDFYGEHDIGWFKLSNSNVKVHWNIFYFHQIDGSQIEEWGVDIQDPSNLNSTLRQLCVKLDYEL